MKSISLFLTHNTVTPEALNGKLAIVIDILRASNSIIAALSHGANALYPVDTISGAYKLKMEMPSALLCGERDAEIIEGFDIGNSPFEFTKEKVSGKRLIFASSNGSKALLASAAAAKSIVSSFNNLSASVEFASGYGEIAIVCSGVNGEFSLEDFFYAGYLISKCLDASDEYELTDIARVAKSFAESQCDIYETIKNAKHGKYLHSIGYTRDIEYASRLDITNVIPIWDTDCIR